MPLNTTNKVAPSTERTFRHYSNNEHGASALFDRKIFFLADRNEFSLELLNRLIILLLLSMMFRAMVE